MNKISKTALHGIAKKSSRDFYDRTHHIEIFVLGLLARPKSVALGIGAGALSFMFKVTFSKLYLEPAAKPIDISKNNQTAAKKNITEKYVVFRILSTIAPIMEEISFRVIIQRSLAWSVDKIFQLHEKYFGKTTLWKISRNGIDCCGYILTANKIAICLTAVFFIAMHKRKTTLYNLLMIPESLMMGYLADKEGVISSIFAHITLNSLCTFPELL